MHLLPRTMSDSQVKFDVSSHNALHRCSSNSPNVSQHSVITRQQLDHSLTNNLPFSLPELDAEHYHSLSMDNIRGRNMISLESYLHNDFLCDKSDGYGVNYNINGSPPMQQSYNGNSISSVNSIMSDHMIPSNNIMSLDLNMNNHMHSQLQKISNYGLVPPSIFDNELEDGCNIVKSNRVVSDNSCCSQSSNSSKSERSSQSCSSLNSNSNSEKCGSNTKNENSTKMNNLVKQINNSMPYSSLQVQQSVINDPRLMISSNLQQVASNQNHPARSIPVDNFQPRHSFRLGLPSLYGYHSPMIGPSHSPVSPPIRQSQFNGLLTNITGLTGLSNFTGNNPSNMFPSQRGSMCSEYNSGTAPRYMVDGGPSHLVDESLPTFPNASAAPNRLPAHKPVRLTQPKHPLAPPGTPVYFKYGEEHYPEETVPPEYTFTETDGTVCRYITNFLVYNKRGERLLPIEVLDQPRHAALVLYGSLLPSGAMAQNNTRSSKKDADLDSDSIRGKKRSGSIRSGNASKRHMNSGSNSSVRDPVSNICSRSNSILQSYPVRVELAEWCIDYGQEPSNVPFIWLISRWDVYYRLEKPAGRYIPTFATAKMKFEVSTRVIKTLQHRPDTEYTCLVELLTAATRMEKIQKKIEKRELARKKRQASKLLGKRKQSLTLKSENEFTNECKPGTVFSENNSIKFEDNTNGTETNNSGNSSVGYASTSNPDDFYDFIHTSNEPGSTISSHFSGSQTKKKNRNWRIQSLSTPQGTGVVIADEEGRPQALTPWGAPYAVDGFKESMLLGLAEFLESQLRNFMEGIGSIKDGSCPNLLNTSFMRQLRERTAYRMETLQLVEAKRRELEVVKSLAEAASSNSSTGSNSINLENMPNAMNQQSMANVNSSLSNITSSNLDSHFIPFSRGLIAGNTQTSHSNNFSIRSNPHYFNGEVPQLSSGCQSILSSPQHYYSPSNLGIIGRRYNCSMLNQTNQSNNLLATSSSINVLESEIRHLQQLLKDSDGNEDSDINDDDSENEESLDDVEKQSEDHDSNRNTEVSCLNGCYGDEERSACTNDYGSSTSPPISFKSVPPQNNINNSLSSNIGNLQHTYNTSSQDFTNTVVNSNSFQIGISENQNMIGLNNSMHMVPYSRSDEELFDFSQNDSSNYFSHQKFSHHFHYPISSVLDNKKNNDMNINTVMNESFPITSNSSTVKPMTSEELKCNTPHYTEVHEDFWSKDSEITENVFHSGYEKTFNSYDIPESIANENSNNINFSKNSKLFSESEQFKSENKSSAVLDFSVDSIDVF